MRSPLILVATLILATPAFAQQDGAARSDAGEQELRQKIGAATRAPDFKSSQMLLEVYRTLRAAGVTLSSAEAFEMGDEARRRGFSIEAVESYALLNVDDEEFRHNALLIESVRQAAARDRNGDGVEESVASARQRNDDYFWVFIAEALAVQGDDQRAIEFYQIALNHNQRMTDNVEARASEASKMYGRSIEFYRIEFAQHPCGWSGSAPLRFCSAELARIQLDLGISLFRLGRVSDARATWSAITGSPCVEILAKAWIDIADRAAN